MHETQNFLNKLKRRVLSRKYVYVFKDLPTTTKKELLQLQNSSELLQTGGRNIGVKLFWLFLLGVPFVIFIAHFNSSVDPQLRHNYGVISLIFLMWIFYVIFTLFETMKAPIANKTVLSRTQTCEITNGFVRYRNLKDASNISVTSFRAQTQRYYHLQIAYEDDDDYIFTFLLRGTENQMKVAEKWHEIALKWRADAIAADNLSDAAYFSAHDIFNKTDVSEVPLRFTRSHWPLIAALMIVTFAVCLTLA